MSATAACAGCLLGPLLWLLLATLCAATCAVRCTLGWCSKAGMTTRGDWHMNCWLRCWHHLCTHFEKCTAGGTASIRGLECAAWLCAAISSDEADGKRGQSTLSGARSGHCAQEACASRGASRASHARQGRNMTYHLNHVTRRKCHDFNMSPMCTHRHTTYTMQLKQDNKRHRYGWNSKLFEDVIWLVIFLSQFMLQCKSNHQTGWPPFDRTRY